MATGKGAGWISVSGTIIVDGKENGTNSSHEDTFVANNDGLMECYGQLSKLL